MSIVSELVHLSRECLREKKYVFPERFFCLAVIHSAEPLASHPFPPGWASEVEITIPTGSWAVPTQSRKKRAKGENGSQSYKHAFGLVSPQFFS